MAAATQTLRTHDTLLTQAVPDEDAIPTLMNQIQQIAQATGVIMDTLQFSGRTQASVEGEGVGTVSLQVAVSGTYGQLERFLETVEGASRLIDVSSVNLGADAARVNLSLPLTAYYLPVIPFDDVSTAAITLNLTDPAFTEIVTAVQALQYYDTPVDVRTGIGKSDPFSSSIPSPGQGQPETSPSASPGR